VALLQAKKEAVACEVRTAKELADTHRHSSLKHQMLLLERFHSSIIKSWSNGDSKSKSEGENGDRSGGKSGSKPDSAAELSTVDPVDEVDGAEEDARSHHDPSPLVQQSSVLIYSKIKVGVCVCVCVCVIDCTASYPSSLPSLPFNLTLLSTFEYYHITTMHALSRKYCTHS
jgi:hypothetical protein